MPIEDRHVLIRREQVHHLVDVARDHSQSGLSSNSGRCVNTIVGAMLGNRARSLFSQAIRSGPTSGLARDTLRSDKMHSAIVK